MPVVLDHPVDDEGAAVIPGRPDFGNPRFGITRAKKHPPYVFSIRGLSCLVHRVLSVELHWYRVVGSGHSLMKQKRPLMIANTACGAFFRLDPRVSRTCRVPNPEALLCGRCHGLGATFPGRHRMMTDDGITRQAAHVKLGCVVQGY